MSDFAEPLGRVVVRPFQRDRWNAGSDARAADREHRAEQLLVRLRLDDVTALDAALRQYWGPVLAYLTRWLGSADAAEDVAQRTFVRLWERRLEWRLDGSLRGLLFRVARNLAISDQRNRRARERAQERFGRSAPGEARSALQSVEDRQLGARLEVAIGQLPERRREVFVLRCVHGFSHREIAELMSISEQTVANQLNRALATLRSLLADVLS